MDIRVYADGRLDWPGGSLPCRLGRGGVRADKREGDGTTPVGRFPLRRVLWRADPIATDDGWCDDPADPAYNRPVRLPFAPSHEALWRTDGLYDVIVVLGHNDDPVVPGMGSAVFLHVADPAGAPTAGCVALPLPDLLRLLADCAPGDGLVVACG